MGSLFPKAPAPPPAPTVTPPPPMPDPTSPSTVAAQNAAMAKAAQGGRTSTVLTTAASRASGTLAGSYGGAKLGSG